MSIKPGIRTNAAFRLVVVEFYLSFVGKIAVKVHPFGSAIQKQIYRRHSFAKTVILISNCEFWGNLARNGNDKQVNLLVFSAHAADFCSRSGGAIALHTLAGASTQFVDLTFGERAESEAHQVLYAGRTISRVAGAAVEPSTDWVCRGLLSAQRSRDHGFRFQAWDWRVNSLFPALGNEKIIVAGCEKSE